MIEGSEVRNTVPIAYVSEWTATQLMVGYDGNYRLTIKNGQVALFTAPPAAEADLTVTLEAEGAASQGFGHKIATRQGFLRIPLDDNNRGGC